MTIKGMLLSSTAIAGTAAGHASDYDWLAERFAVSQVYLRRRPRTLKNPLTGQVFWVEGEPDNWREIMSEAQQEDAVLAQMQRANGGLN